MSDIGKDLLMARKDGEWDMFELITNAYYGKQYYFREEGDDIVYSRASGKHMPVNDAINEFIKVIGDLDE